MITMDLKCGSWVGDMYQKFEAMCVEVEEVMYEDTFKYVENHVQNVGESVKKFYSDVMQDILPSSPLDPVKEDALTFVGHHGDVKKKPKVDEDGSEKLVKDFGVASAHEGSLNYVSSCSPIFSVIKPCKPMSIDSAGENSAKEKSWSEGTELVLSNRAPSEAKHPNFLKDSNECRSDFPCIKTTTNTGSEVTCNQPCVHVEGISSKEVPAMNHNENDGMGICRVMIECHGGDAIKVKKLKILSGGPLTTDLNGQLSKDLALSSMEADVVTSKSSMENIIKSDKEHSTFETETSNPFLSTEWKKCEADEGYLVERLNEVRLGESCVLVEKSDRFSKPSLQSVQKSYKKKIQDVLCPRRWSKSKQDKGYHADWYDEQRGKSTASTTDTMQADVQKSLMSESFESDWELL